MSQERNLSEEEQSLWQHAMRNTKPLIPNKTEILKSSPSERPAETTKKK